MISPVRLQLSRRKGFDLQAISRAYNGRDAVKVTRPGRWGNPFIVNPRVKAGGKSGADYTCVPTIEDAVACFREMLETHPEHRVEVVEKLRGKNLACWCRPGNPCHADVLLELANAGDS